MASWTPEIVEARQKDLEEVFANKWDLKISKGDSPEDPTYNWLDAVEVRRDTQCREIILL